MCVRFSVLMWKIWQELSVLGAITLDELRCISDVQVESGASYRVCAFRKVKEEKRYYTTLWC